MPADGARVGGRRLLWLVGGALLAAAVALWGASRLRWIDVPPGSTVDGRLVEELTGSDVVAWTVPLALVALAAVAAAIALPPAVRRVLGVLLVVAGIVAVTLAFGTGVEDVTWTAPAPGYEDVGGAPTRALWGPASAVLGGLLLVVSGAVLVWRADALPRMGARYRAPGSRQAPSAGEQDMWKALSDGDDPTRDP